MNPFLEEAYERPLPTKTDDFREKIISEISKTTDDPAFIKAHSSCKGTDFTRRRRLSFKAMIVLLTQGLVRSSQRELNAFFQKVNDNPFAVQQVHKSAFTHARSKLLPSSFIELNQLATDNFYKYANYKKWYGFRLLAIDGTTLMLPKHPTIEKEFGVTGFGRYADSDRSVAKVSLLYDVLNCTTLGAEIAGYRTGEREQAINLLRSTKPGLDLVILDRGYMSNGLMFRMINSGIHFCMRLRGDWMVKVREMKRLKFTDIETDFVLGVNDLYLLKEFNVRNPKFRCRIVAVKLPDGNMEYLCTSVLDKNIIATEDFMELYHYRWGIEENYKLVKTRMQMEAFSGKTALAIRRDFFANVFMMSIVSIMTYPIDKKVEIDQQSKRQRKHLYQTNKTNALAFLRDSLCRIFQKGLINEGIKAFDYLLHQTLEIVRPGRSYPRNHIKKKPPAMCYKQL